MKPWGAILCLLAALPCGAGQAPEPLPPDAFSARVLPNGLTVLVRRAPAPLAVAALWVRAGSADGPDGAAHALEHVLFKGSDTVPSGGADAAAEAAGGEIDAATLRDAARYRTQFPADRLSPSLGALAALVRPPTVAPSDWESERRVMLEELARPEPDPVVTARNVLTGRLFEPPFGTPVSGTVDAIRSLTPEALREFHRRNYTPARMTLVVVGDLEPAAVFDAARTAFDSLASGAAPAASLAPKAALPLATVAGEAGGMVTVGRAFSAPDADPLAADVLARVLRRRLAAAARLATRTEVIRASERARALTLVATGPAGERKALEGALADVAAGAATVTPAEVDAAVYSLAWERWQALESPAAQADAIGRAAAQGDWRNATGVTARLAAMRAADVLGAAKAIFGSPAEPPLPGGV